MWWLGFRQTWHEHIPHWLGLKELENRVTAMGYGNTEFNNKGWGSMKYTGNWYVNVKYKNATYGNKKYNRNTGYSYMIFKGLKIAITNITVKDTEMKYNNTGYAIWNSTNSHVESCKNEMNTNCNHHHHHHIQQLPSLRCFYIISY